MDSETNEPQQRELAVGSRLGHYVIVEKIASGGMGTVYKALEPALERYVAIKILHGTYAEDPQYQSDFQEEARAIASLRHNNIVPLYFIGDEEGLIYFAMAYIEGSTLDMWLDEGHRLDSEWAMWFMTQAIAALDYAWRFNIVHLDIKPSNFVVDADNILMLTDFGLAQRRQRLVGEEKRELLGTPGYASPEQIMQREPDLRSDMYALGATLFHLMAGVLPFEGDSGEEVCRQHVQTPFPADKALKAGVPRGWTSLMHKLMEKNPDDRFQTYAEITAALADIDNFRYGNQVVTPPASMRRRALPRQSKPPETLYGLIPSNFPTADESSFEIKKTFTAAQTEDTLNRRGPLLALNAILEDVEQICQPIAGDLLDLVSAMAKMPVFQSTVNELIGFFRNFTSGAADDDAAKIEMLGLHRARSLALTTLMLQKKWQPAKPLDWRGLWEHQIACAIFVEMMFDMLRIETSGYEFAAGLFHDIGKLVFAELNPATYVAVMMQAMQHDIPLAQAEVEVFGLHHGELGEMWFHRNKIDKNIGAIVQWHEYPEQAAKGMKEGPKLSLAMFHGKSRNVQLLNHAVASANHLVKELGIGFSGDTFLEQCPWSELPSTLIVWEARHKKDLAWEEFVGFFTEGCKKFPQLTLPGLATPAKPAAF